MSSSIDKKAIQEVFENPKLKRNLRSQISRVAELLPNIHQGWLACEFAEHVEYIWLENTEQNPLFKETVSTLRQFLQGNITIEAVQSARVSFMNYAYGLYPHKDFAAAIASIVGSTIYLAIKVCCQRELEKARYVIYNKHLPTVAAVAFDASYAVARYTAGLNWDSDDKALRAVARQKGHAASDDESQWQIVRLREYCA